MDKESIEKILEVLERERAAAACADFDELAATAKLKDKLLARLAAEDMEIGALQAVTRGLDRNQKIIAAVISGIKAARSFITAEMGATKKVNIYNEAGTIQTFGDHEVRSSRKY